MIIGEPVDLMIQRVLAGRSDDAALAHRAAPAQLEPERLVAERARPGQHRAAGRTEALAEIDPDRIERPRVVGRGDAARDARIEQACAVHVRREAGVARDLRDAFERRQRPDRAAAEVRCLFDHDEALTRRVRTIGPDRGAQLLRAEDAAPSGQRLDHDAGERGGSAAFEADDVRGRVAEDFLAGTAMHGERDLVRHRAGRQEHRVFLAEQRRAALVEPIDRRVFVGALVTDLGSGHRGAHAGGRAGLGVAGEVDQGGRGHGASMRERNRAS